MKTILFVYGTLKRGGSNVRLMAGQEFHCEAITEPRYRLIDLGSHPGMIRDDANGLAVAGELWAVDAPSLAALDAFEEIPGPFVREAVAIAGRGDVVQAYYWNREVPTGARSGKVWPFPGEPGA